MIELTPKQLAALPHIEWLLDDWLDPINLNNRATGRSFLMAVIFIRMAQKSPGRWIEIFDHFPHPRNRKFMLDSVSRLAQKENLKFEIKLTTNSFRIVPE